MEWGTAIGWIGGVAATAIILILKAHLEARKEDRGTRRKTSLEDRQRRMDTDRDTYGRLLAILLKSELPTFIRTGKRRSDVGSLLLSLEQGAYEDFVDPEVNTAWVRLIAKTVELARKRQDNNITPIDIQEYNEQYRAWEDAAKRSFGPLPDSPALAGTGAARGGDGQDAA